MRCILLASLLSLAPLAAQPFEPGVYTSRSGNGTISWQLLFCMKQGSSVYRVSGQFGDGALAMQVDGRYDPTSNRLNASTFKPEAFGIGAPIALLDVGGFWDENSQVFTVTPAGLARENLKREAWSPKPGEPWVRLTLDVPRAQQAGQPIRATVRLEARNVSAPFVLALRSDLLATSLPIDDDDEYEFELADLLPVTAPHDLASFDLVVSAECARPSVYEEARASIDLTAPASPVRPIHVRPRIARTTRSGDTVGFTLDYALKVANTLDCAVRQRVAIEPFGEPGAAVPLPDKDFVAHGSPTGADVPIQTWQFEAPAAGRYRLRYTIEGDGMAPYVGAEMFDVEPAEGGGGGATPAKPSDAKARLSGAITVARPTVEVDESAPTTVTLSNPDSADDLEVDTVFRILGPKGAVVSERTKRYTLSRGKEKKGELELRFQAPGEYTLELLVTGDRVETFRRDAKITVEPKPKDPPAVTGPTGNTGASNPTGAEGSYGLIKKVVGKAAPTSVEPYGTWSGSQGESSFSATYTSKEPWDGHFNLTMSWSQPPATLRPGEIVELTCSASAQMTGKDAPGVGVSGEWVVSGGECEMLERTNAFVGLSSSTGKQHPSAQGKYRVKIGRGGEIEIYSRHPGLAWGTGGEWNPCIYTYGWNQAPTVQQDPPATGGDPPPTTEDAGPGAATITSLTPDDPDDAARISARLDPTELTLFAGEPSKIVDVHITGYRRNTEDRVEVVFPQRTDSWASLPGQIVVGGGDGSYWPPNMGTPEHVDGYFFSARSTARGGTFTIWWLVRQKGAGAVRIPLTVRVVARPGRAGTGGFTPPGGVTSSDGGQRVIPVGATSTFDGAWDTDAGRITFTVNGNQVTGMLNDIAPIDGAIDGGKMTFHFRVNPARHGELELAPDGATWKGYYMEPDPDGAYKMFLTGRRAAR